MEVNLNFSLEEILETIRKYRTLGSEGEYKGKVESEQVPSNYDIHLNDIPMETGDLNRQQRGEENPVLNNPSLNQNNLSNEETPNISGEPRAKIRFNEHDLNPHSRLNDIEEDDDSDQYVPRNPEMEGAAHRYGKYFNYDLLNLQTINLKKEIYHQIHD